MANLSDVLAKLIGDAPLIEDAVKMVEKLFTGQPGAGAAKYDAVSQIVTDALKVYLSFTGKNVDTAALEADLKQLIPEVVKFYNDAGIFIHAVTAAPVPTPKPTATVSPAGKSLK